MNCEFFNDKKKFRESVAVKTMLLEEHTIHIELKICYPSKLYD